jgi:hypothetical protein
MQNEAKLGESISTTVAWQFIELSDALQPSSRNFSIACLISAFKISVFILKNLEQPLHLSSDCESLASSRTYRGNTRDIEFDQLGAT